MIYTEIDVTVSRFKIWVNIQIISKLTDVWRREGSHVPMRLRGPSADATISTF